MTDARPPEDQTGARPSRPQRRADLAAWSARTFLSETPLVDPPPAELSLDDEVAYDILANVDETRAHIAALRADGLL